MKRTIPQCRDRLELVAVTLDAMGYPSIAQDIRSVVKDMVRKSPVRRAKVKHNPLTETEKQQIREMAKANPNTHISEIAIAFDVNPGRVSEALRSE